ncbi:unnamed protein product [Diatraea saccharalis]|uniref:Hemolin n=1 Tax=Diatraea saccharalis TaxID=40085 RepID=A0A9N9QT12_9NEOP|nr:unnamed protein product [Diatraea saccharalis]
MCKTVFLLLAIFVAISYGDDKSSLTFVIDDTGSMSDDIAQVKEGVNLIFDTVTNSNVSLIEDFVLVTFNDPHVTFRTATKSKEVFKQQLASITVTGGGDCPEMAMTGIETALSSSKPKSYLYVFTDASAKDYSKLETIQSKAIKDSSQVVFLLTGRCTANDNDPDYQAYYKLAEATSGQVFHLGKQNVKEILHYIAEQIESPKTIITAKKFPPGPGHNLTFPVDPDMKTLIVSESGKEPTIDVRSPDGSVPDTKTVVDLPEVIAIRIDDTIPGNYTAVVGSKSETSVVVTATTSIKFKHGFSVVPPTNIGDTATRPVSDEKTHLSIKLETPDNDKILASVEILDIKENVRHEMPLTLINEKEKFYSTKDFQPPEYLFKIAVKGLDTKTNTTFKRIGPTPIEVQRPIKGVIDAMAPSIKFDGGLKIDAVYNEPLKISCKVRAYPKPDIIWVDNSGTFFPTTVSIVELPYDYISIMSIDKITKNSTYTCKASNTHGDYSKNIDVVTMRKEYFNIIEVPKDTTIEYRKSGKIICNVDAFPPANIAWYSKETKLHTDEFFDISHDGTVLIIRDMLPHLNKSYSCQVKNDDNKETFPFNIILLGFEKPEIEKTPPILHGIKGNNSEIICRIIKGSPKPQIVWYFKAEGNKRFSKLNESGEVLLLRNLDFSNEGVYTCHVSNDAGQDFKEVTLVVDYAPYIDQDKFRVISRHGESTTLKCQVHGVPKPKVSWFHDGIEIFNDREHHIYRDHSLRFKGSLANNGQFVCIASNTVGTASRTVQVDYIVPVAIEPPKVSTFEMNFGDRITLPCQADGYPRPTIKWIFYNTVTKRRITIRPSDNSGSLNLYNLHPQQGGYYSCVARNVDSSANITYHITVLEKPYIHNNNPKKTFTVVTRDLVHVIPCQASGNPKPEITWSKNGLNIAAGTEWYDIQDDGTLVIKNIDEVSAGSYVCKAQNKVGEDSQAFHVIVRPFPDTITPTEIINLQENSTVDLVCNISHTRLDYIRWYKDRKLVSEGELTLRNVKISDAGIYTCRVSTFSESTSKSTRLIVGSAPTFIGDTELTINYEDNIPTFLDCEAFGEPTPEIVWLQNGKQLDSRKMLLEFEMTSDTRGQYQCIVKNIYGTINRTFEIISRECFLNMEEGFMTTQPIMVEPRFLRAPQFEISNGFVRIPTEESLLLYCPSGFSNIPRSEVIATCEGDMNFNIEGRTFKYSELNCQEEVTPLIRRTGSQCSSENTEKVLVGFEIRGEFLEVYEICMDKATNTPVYAKTKIHRSIPDVSSKNDFKWFGDDSSELNFDDIYDCNRQINDISSRLRKWFHFEDRCCFKSRKLVNPRDLIAGISQKTAYTYLNVVPQWSTCGTENWDILEDKIRNLAKSSYDDLVVWTGISEHLTINNAASIAENINLFDATGHQQAVPQYLWKVVQNPATRSSLAIVQVNMPDLTISEAFRHMLCRDICRDIPWMADQLTWRDPTKGFTFCCSLDEFETAFHLENLFGDNRRILHIASLPKLR